jgi:RimJ/RimL family protein N-acetyltransferase
MLSGPPIHWEPHVLTFMLDQFTAHPDQIGWHRYVALPDPGSARTLIGCLGAFSKDDPPATCEIGYAILPSFEGKGYATEGTQALIRFLRAGTRITCIIAHTFPTLPRSIRVMEKCGLVFDGNGDSQEPFVIASTFSPEQDLPSSRRNLRWLENLPAP